MDCPSCGPAAAVQAVLRSRSNARDARAVRSPRRWLDAENVAPAAVVPSALSRTSSGALGFTRTVPAKPNVRWSGMTRRRSSRSSSSWRSTAVGSSAQSGCHDVEPMPGGAAPRPCGEVHRQPNCFRDVHVAEPDLGEPDGVREPGVARWFGGREKLDLHASDGPPWEMHDLTARRQ